MSYEYQDQDILMNIPSRVGGTKKNRLACHGAGMTQIYVPWHAIGMPIEQKNFMQLAYHKKINGMPDGMPKYFFDENNKKFSINHETLLIFINHHQ
jgi:hypothetical protein